MKGIWWDFLLGFYVWVCVGVSSYALLYGAVDRTEWHEVGFSDDMLWEYENSNESNWYNYARECYPIAVSITGLIYQVFSRNIKVSFKTNYIDSIPIYIAIAWHLLYQSIFVNVNRKWLCYIAIAWHLSCQSRLANANWKWLCLSFSFPSFVLFLFY